MQGYQLSRGIGGESMDSEALDSIVEAAPPVPHRLPESWFVLGQGLQESGASLPESGFVGIRKQTHQLPSHRFTGHLRLGSGVQGG